MRRISLSLTVRCLSLLVGSVYIFACSSSVYTQVDAEGSSSAGSAAVETVTKRTGIFRSGPLVPYL